MAARGRRRGNVNPVERGDTQHSHDAGALRKLSTLTGRLAVGLPAPREARKAHDFG